MIDDSITSKVFIILFDVCIIKSSFQQLPAALEHKRTSYIVSIGLPRFVAHHRDASIRNPQRGAHHTSGNTQLTLCFLLFPWTEGQEPRPLRTNWIIQKSIIRLLFLQVTLLLQDETNWKAILTVRSYRSAFCILVSTLSESHYCSIHHSQFINHGSQRP